ncbi:long-chain acyl-CoA synthetase [Streptomyces sp. SAI-208]|uniref:AMP-dependent synthetase/ligase n=1 Tax=unclassified Streptomyces TaxID=2593676 RepID=UPI002474018D|nr:MULTISPECIES: AMP-dependent synthetase/ligase [unclassified Streptomyces]MDH6517268.1 long-chain acyl-CoA synthetase [Streptomyces sp. SAI-090]MDH6549490.1 long-chain acyl-CoA synthetase [Streptomyces sp. SAI-041]MDH6568548.1 long-chain acyl-CoA synthetase [Streptomyces sp. SAI-117]MDH6586503.1 long-chain acyl-CoA synthetase [Streptomyces sp. SAI-133]MDH6608084.1 long-chain acyl-CoA synthetase [Streptomyces sp. SAI-208]
MSLSYVSGHDYDGAPVLVEPEIVRLDGEVREVSVPPLVPPVTHGSLADLPFDNAEAAPQQRVMSRRTEDGRWVDLTAAEFAQQVLAVAKGLISEGLMPGDRVAIMARTTYEWTLLDFAAWAAGLVTVPIYPTSSVFQTRFILQDSGAVALVTETAAQAAALGPELSRLPDLRHMWVMEKGHVDRLAELGQAVPEQEIGVRRGMLGPGTVATVVYTSGTTGRPKGCVLSHGNFLAEIDNAVELLYPVFKSKSQEADLATLLFLPISHVFGRMVAIACVRARVRLGHAPSLQAEDLLADLASFKPTFLLVIPYMLEKVFNNARAKAESGGRVTVFDRATNVAVRYGEAVEARNAGTGSGPGAALRAARTFYDPLVYRRIRNAMGGRIRHIISGGSPLGRRLAAFYAGAGMEIYEGYGLTESTGAATVTPPLKSRLGTVGWPLPGTRIRIAADGEILLSGGQVFRGYWDPYGEGVAPASADGWFPTGDIGQLDDEGYLTITGRKKEILITAGGKNVAPAPLENWLRSHPLISQCMVLGDRRPYISALISLDMDGVNHWRQMNGKHPVPAELLVNDDELRQVLQRAVDEANKMVSRPESIRRFTVLPTDLTEAAGHLTPSMKLRREAVMRDFAGEIEGLYER